MLDIIKNALKSPELRKKLLYTLLIVVIFRVGSYIPVPFLDPARLGEIMGDGNLLGYLDMMTGGALSNATLFAMSITPYINASIIMQLLTVAIPPLERLQKEGEEGRKKITQITRYVTIGLALIQALGYYFLLRSPDVNAVTVTTGWHGWLVMATIILVFTAGASLIMWLGERINVHGIGNGISILLFAGIISRLPSAVGSLYGLWQQALAGETQFFYIVPAIVLIFLAIIAFIVVMTNAERRIPVQYAKRVVGRKMYGGQSSHIPIKVNMSGVMPIIFASSFLSIPGTIKALLNNPDQNTFWNQLAKAFDYTGALYAILYFFLIIGFNYFYVSIQYNPIEMANNLRKSNGAIPGIRPGKPTIEFISKVIGRIVLVGGLFLGAIAVFPIVFSGVTGSNIALGGTSILIVVGVALETVRTLESQMMMRHHKGFLE